MCCLCCQVVIDKNYCSINEEEANLKIESVAFGKSDFLMHKSHKDVTSDVLPLLCLQSWLLKKKEGEKMFIVCGFLKQNFLDISSTMSFYFHISVWFGKTCGKHGHPH